MTDEEEQDAALAQPADLHEGEVFDLEVEPNDAPIELFELHFPRPPQGTWKEKFDIRADVRFAYMTLKFDNVFVRVATKAARLSSACTGCALLPHSLYGLNPLPPRNVIAVQEKQTREVAGGMAAQMQAKVGVLQGADASSSIDAKASAEAAHRIEKQGVHEESVSRVVPRPHGAWELTEPNKPDGCLDGDYLTSRGQYLDSPPVDSADLPLATVQANYDAEQISIELAIEIQPKDLVFHRIRSGGERAPRTWFQRENINVEIIARRLIEMTHRDASQISEPKIKLGRATLRGKRRSVSRGS